MLKDKYKITQLFDFYGELLTSKQKMILELYLGDDLALVEIAENLSISRQAVYDHVNKAVSALIDYEEKLGLLARFNQREQMLLDLRQDLLDLSYNSDASKQKILKQIEAIINF